MRGRTNLGGGSGNLFVDGNVETGIVDSYGSIVSGDFVEKTVTKKELNSTMLPVIPYRIEDAVSDNFLLEDGSFCTFFRTNKSSTNLKVWFYRIENNEIIDDGFLDIAVFSDWNSWDSFKIVQITERAFIIVCSGGRDSSLSSYRHGYSKITISGKSTIEVEYLGEKLDAGYYSGFLRFEKLNEEKFVIMYERHSSSSSTNKGTYIYVVKLESGAISFGEEYSLSEYFLCSSIYEDGSFIVFDTNNTAYLFKADDTNIKLVRSSKVYESNSSNIYDSIYIGNGQTLIAKKGKTSSVIGQILTLTDTASGLSSEREIASASFAPNSISFYKKSGKIFIVAGNAKSTTTTSGTVQNRRQDYAIGTWDSSSVNGEKLIDIFSESLSYPSSTYNWSIHGLSLDAKNLSISILKINATQKISSYLMELGFRMEDTGIESLESVTKFRKRVSRIDGVAKQSGSPGALIEVYVPK